jgi:diguanylate cyclase (GGDEF)-like protein
MSIEKKVLLTVTLLAFIFLSVFYFIQKTIVFPVFTEIEIQHAQSNLNRVEELLDDNIDQINRYSYDLSSWDDTYQFAQDSNEKYIQSNLTSDTFLNNQINIVYFLTVKKTLIWGEVYTFSDKELDVVTDHNYIQQSLNLLQHNIDGIDLSLQSGALSSKGIFVQDNTPILFSIHPILTTEGLGPAQGYLILGRTVDDVLIEKFKNQTKTTFEINIISPEVFSNDKSLTKKIHIKQSDDNFIEIQKNYFSNNIPVISIAATSPKDITRNGLKSIIYALSALFIIGLLSILSVWALLKFSILRPVASLTKEIVNISTHTDYSLRSKINKKDEIGILAKEFNCMLTILDANHLELKKTYLQIKADNKKIRRTESALKEANSKLEKLTVTDPLTGIANRLCIQQKLEGEWSALRRSKQSLSILMIDIDFFKLFNDHYGHQAGDKCLIQVASSLKRCMRRPNDLAARYGGEEFILIIPRSDINAAKQLAQNVRDALALEKIEHLHSEVDNIITVSIGIASIIPSQDSTIESLIHQADSALYEAKKNGRNRIDVAVID